MEIYKVGGVVRNRLINRIYPELKLGETDTDYVVVGSTPEEMLTKGFKQVGKDFPVFLHPETRDEYALARTERSTGKGHGDFKFDFSNKITLEDDLRRRDFTINAIAEDCEGGCYIDPFDGKADIQHKIIRHIDPDAFMEDPLRVLRGCRFAAQLGFNIDYDTLQLFKEMVDRGDLKELTKDRVWKELRKSLVSPYPRRFFDYAKECGALKVILPEIQALEGCEENLEYHPEGNTYEHTMLALEKSPAILACRISVLFHDIGKIESPLKEGRECSRPEHPDKGVEIIKRICERLRIPTKYEKYSELVCKYHMKRFEILKMRPTKILRLLSEVSGKFRNIRLYYVYIKSCYADIQGKNNKIKSRKDLLEFYWIERWFRILLKTCKKEKFTNIPNWEKFKPEHRDNAWFEYLAKVCKTKIKSMKGEDL